MAERSNNASCFTMTGTNAPTTMTAATHPTTPIQITCPGLDIQTGDTVVITGTVGNTACNGTWIATRVDINTFTIPATSNGGWISGGLCTIQNRTTVSFAGHGVRDGDKMVISGTVGNTACNGSWSGLIRLDDNKFTIPVTANAAWSSGGYCVDNPIQLPSPGTYWGYVVTTPIAVAPITLYDHASAASGTVVDVIPSGTPAGAIRVLESRMKLTNGLYFAPGTATGRLLMLLD